METPARRRRRGLLLLVVAAAAALRLVPLGLDSFWLDEATTARASGLPFGDMLVDRARAGHPPLFFVLTWLLTRLPGPDELLLRLPAALAGVGAVWVLYRLTEALAGRGAALLAAALLAVHPQQLELASMARAYAVVALVGLASSWLLVAGEKRTDQRGEKLAGDARPRWDRAGRLAAYAALTVVAVHLHYSALLVVAAQVAWLAARRRWRMVLAGLGGAASVLPWFLWSGSVGYAAEQNLVWIPPFSDLTVALWLSTQLVDLDLRWMRPVTLAARWLVLVPVFALAAVGALRAGRPERREVRLLAWLWLVPPALALASVALGTNVLHKARYLATSSTVLAALVAVGIVSLRLPARGRGAVAAACLALGAAACLAEVGEPMGTDWRGVVRVLEAERRPGEELLVLPDVPMRLLTLRHYHHGPYRLLGEAPATGEPARGVWIALSPHAFATVAGRDPAAAAAARAELARLERRFPGRREHPLRSGTLLHFYSPVVPQP